MADILVHTIQFIDDNPFGTFVSGDVVSIYYNPDDDPSPALSSTVGYTVKKNDVEIFAGDDVFFQTYSYKIETSQNAQICNGTTLVIAVRQISNFPYVFSYVEPDNPSCAVDPETCNLIISGTPEVDPASGPTESDGEITIIAQSSNPIQYKLGSPFLYDDGTAQSSGNFSGLHPGDYRIYIRDSLNCSTDVLVTVGYNDTYSPLYRLEYYDPTGGKSRIDITKRAYAGSVIDVCGTRLPFQKSLRGEGSLNKFEPILSSQATVNLVSQTDFYFQQLFTNNPEEYRINFYKQEVQDVVGLVSWNNTNPDFDGDLSGWSVYDSGTDVAWVYGGLPQSQQQGAKAFLDSGLVMQTLYQAHDITAGDLLTFEYSFARNAWSNSPLNVIGLYVVFLEDDVPVDDLLIDNLNSYGIGSLTQNTKNITAPVTCNGVGFRLEQNNGTDRIYLIENFLITHSYQDITPGTLDFVLKGRWKVLPQQYQEIYKAPPYYVSVVATDSLPSLKDYLFLQDDGQRFNSLERQIYLVAYILKKLKLDLPIRVACNLYATTMDQADLNDPLDQAYIDTDCYYLAEADPTLDFVLRAILEPYGASIIQEDGRWNIVRVEEKRGEYDYRDFDKDGNVIGHGSYNPIGDIEAQPATNCFHWVNADQNMELRPGYGKIIIYYNLGLRNNILENGDFRLKTIYNPSTNTYSYTIDKYGFQLVNSGYPMTESFERLSNNNVSYLIRSTSTATAGEAYLQSDTYIVKMGIQNSLKIKVRFKIPSPGTNILYQKVRLRVKYGTKYLQSNGLWTTDENLLIFFVNKFNEYTEVDIVAYSPDVGAADGYDFDVRLYHSFAYHADYSDFNSLIALTADDVDDLPTGLKTQVKSSQLDRTSHVYYYELEERLPQSNFTLLDAVSDRGDYNPTATHEFPTSGGSGTAGAIVKGDVWRVSAATYIDFDTYEREVFVGDKLIALIDAPGASEINWAINFVPEQIVPSGFLFNDKTWIYKGKTGEVFYDVQLEDGTTAVGSVNASFWIDYIAVEFLYNGISPVDTIVREIKAENRNTNILEKTVYNGSYNNVIQTINILGKISSFSRFANTTTSVVTSNILSADLIYAGYLRSSSGIGFSEWARDGVSESTSLHAILLQSLAAQYKRSWRKITGSIRSKDTYMTFLTTLRESFDGDRLYIPISLTIDDFNNTSNGEFLELIDITEGAGSDGSVTSPFSSAFTIGFGSGYD
jgi:hypothetical protein